MLTVVPIFISLDRVRILAELLGIGGKIEYCVAFVELGNQVNYTLCSCFGLGEQFYPVLYLNTGEGIHREALKSKTQQNS